MSKYYINQGSSDFYFKVLAHATAGLTSLKPVGQGARLVTQAEF